jgi:hypothetical protein
MYNVTLDGVFYESYSWTNGTISVNIDGLSVGVYEFIIYVYDSFGNMISDTVMVTVPDNIPPEISNPDDLSYEIGTSGNQIEWTVGDVNPGTYNVTLDGTLYTEGTWTNGTTTLDIDDLAIGAYEFIIYVYDISGNMVSDMVLLTVIAPDSTTPIPGDTDGFSDLMKIGLTGVVIVAVVMGLIKVQDTKFKNSGFAEKLDYKKARKLGFSSKAAQEGALSAGFSNAEEWKTAKASGFENKLDWDNAKTAGFSTNTEWQTALIAGFTTMQAFKDAEEAGYGSYDEMQVAKERNKEDIINKDKQLEVLSSTYKDIKLEAEQFTPDLGENPDDSVVNLKLQPLREKISLLEEAIQLIVLGEVATELNEMLTALEDKKAGMIREIHTLKDILEIKKENLYIEALKQRRSFRLNRILKRVEIMSLQDFAKEMEFENLDTLKQWLLYEMSDNIPLKLSGDTIKIETQRDEDINNAIDDMLSQFQEMERDKIGKIE